MKTNIQVVTDLMEFSNFGALAQLFVIDALSKHAKAVADAKPEELAEMENGFVSAQAWQGVAREILAKLNAHLYQR